MLLKIQKYEANHRRCLPSRTNEEWLEALQKYADAYTDSHESPTSQEIPRPSQGAADDDENRLAHWISRLVTQANGKRGVDDETRVSSYDLLATKIRDILKKSNVEWWISKRRPGRPAKKFDSAKLVSFVSKSRKNSWLVLIVWWVFTSSLHRVICFKVIV